MKHILMTQFLGCVAFGLVVATSVWATETTDHQTEGEPKARVFRFDYGARLNRIPHGAHVRVWLPVPQTNDHQRVEAFETSLPTQAQMAIEPRYGNKILYFELNGSSPGSLGFKTSSLVRRQEVRGLGAAGNGKVQLTEDRVTFSTGRDIDLVPKQAGPPLNFFIYPYVEVDGEPLAKDQMELSFAYSDEDVQGQF